MKVALIQAPLVWEDKRKNIEYFDIILNHLENDVDLVVLPEMFTSGFTMRSESVYSTMEGEEVGWMKTMAKKHSFALTASMIVKDGEDFFNRMFFVFPDGGFKTYDKRHLFSLAGEEKVYKAGVERLIVSYKGWNICPLVCYDLRFPVFSRNFNAAYDLLIYVASWPNQRIYAWDTIIKARAIENMSYVVGVNRCGVDENKNMYSGHSQVVDYLGGYIVEPMIGECVSYVVLDKEKQDMSRSRFGFLKDADQFSL